LKLVKVWSIIHKKELEANWLLAKNCEKPYLENIYKVIYTNLAVVL